MPDLAHKLKMHARTPNTTDMSDESERSEDFGEDSGADMQQVPSDVEDVDTGISLDALTALTSGLAKASSCGVPLEHLLDCLQGATETLDTTM